MTNRGPSLAAVLFVRDEAAVLPRCLAALDGAVDAVYVHDTGSTDATRAIARNLGAIVTEGPWTDDFAAARNTALAGWDGDWALTVDADDRLVADPAGLRDLLAGTTDDALLVDIDNDHDELPYTYRNPRLFRPAALRWTGRVHEHLVPRDGRPAADLPAAPRAVVRLEHCGYATADVRRRKCLRNAALARSTLDSLASTPPAGSDPDLLADTLLDLGRSYVGAGQAQDAVDTFETLRELYPQTRQWVLGTDALARLLLGAGLDDAVLVLTAQLRAAGVKPEYCDWLDAQALAQLGQVDRAWALLEPLTEVVDPAGRSYPPRHLTELKHLLGQLTDRGKVPAAGNQS